METLEVFELRKYIGSKFFDESDIWNLVNIKRTDNGLNTTLEFTNVSDGGRKVVKLFSFNKLVVTKLDDISEEFHDCYQLAVKTI